MQLQELACELVVGKHRLWKGSVGRQARLLVTREVSQGTNFDDHQASRPEYWSPAVVGRLNDYKIQVVKVKGEFTWHTHEGTDEFFLVLAGELAIRLRDREVRLGAGEVFVVPRGVEHCPFAETDCQLLLIEPSGTVNTGEAGGDLTVEEHSI